MTTPATAVRPLTIDIHFNIDEPSKSAIYTDIKPERLQDVLEGWVRAQMGKGADSARPNDKSEYHITIQLDLSFDTYQTQSDTGNEGLTAGIVAEIFAHPDQYRILDLDQAPPSDKQLALVARKHGWTPEIARQKIERTQEILQVDPQDAVAFLLEQFLPNKIICDGCNVNLPHEHRCHGNRSVVRGERMDKPCQCLDCFVIGRLGLTS